MLSHLTRLICQNNFGTATKATIPKKEGTTIVDVLEGAVTRQLFTEMPPLNQELLRSFSPSKNKIKSVQIVIPNFRN
jgi:hypothetical protein